jgi:uncharacterized repeat protein (TIGR01451 family)
LKPRINDHVMLPALIAAFGWMLGGGFCTAMAASADLSLNVSVGPQYLEIYSHIVYTITVSNAGPSTATGVVVSNQIPTNTTFISAAGGAIPTNGVLLVNFGSLAVGAASSAQIVVQRPPEDANLDITPPHITNSTDPAGLNFTCMSPRMS